MKSLTLRAYVPMEQDNWGGLRAPRVWFPEKEISRDAKGGLTVEFKISDNDDSVPERTRFAVTKENYKELSEIVIKIMGGKEWVSKQSTQLLGALINRYAAASDEAGGFRYAFDILNNQRGFGFMGGTGCGTKIHHLTYDKIIGVKKGFPPVVDSLAHMWFAGLSQMALTLRDETKHLRDKIKEEDVYVTLNAHPGCQQTVAGRFAIGYPIKDGKVSDLTCAKCKKRGAV